MNVLVWEGDDLIYQQKAFKEVILAWYLIVVRRAIPGTLDTRFIIGYCNWFGRNSFLYCFLGVLSSEAEVGPCHRQGL